MALQTTIELSLQGYTQFKNNYFVFAKKTTTSITILVVYVDNIIITGDSISSIQSTKGLLHKVFKIKDLGKINYCLGFEVTYVNVGLVLSQRKFTTNHLVDSNIPSFKKVVTPLPLHLKLYSYDFPPFSNPTLYRSLIGKLYFLTNTRPDLYFSV